MPTAKVDIASELKRKAWTREGLLQSAHKSFWTPLTGSRMDSVVYQINNSNAKEGHTVVFDFDGNLSGKPIKDRDQAYGKGEQKRKFSDKITVNRWRLVVDNGDSFDAKDIGDLAIDQHSDSRRKLSDLFHRFKDQAIFDASQGLLGQNPSHIIDLGTSFGYNQLLDIEKTLKTSRGYTTGSVRRPPDAYMTYDGEPCWLFIIDAAMANMLRKSGDYQTLVYNADVRGEKNRAIKGVIGKLGPLLIIEAKQFYGETEKTGVFGLEDTGVEMAGLRQRKVSNNTWSGQPGFSYTSAIKSRGIIVGAGALQIAFGKQPDYLYQPSTDFKITSESAVEFWMNTQKTRLVTENTDYKQAKVSDLDYSVIAVDVQVQS